MTPSDDDYWTSAPTNAMPYFRQWRWPVRSTDDEPTGRLMGWQCPVCKCVNAPFVKQCPCSVGMSLNTNRATSAEQVLAESSGSQATGFDRGEDATVPTWSTIVQSTTGNGQPQEE